MPHSAFTRSCWTLINAARLLIRGFLFIIHPPPTIYTQEDSHETHHLTHQIDIRFHEIHRVHYWCNRNSCFPVFLFPSCNNNKHIGTDFAGSGVDRFGLRSGLSRLYSRCISMGQQSQKHERYSDRCVTCFPAHHAVVPCMGMYQDENQCWRAFNRHQNRDGHPWFSPWWGLGFHIRLSRWPEPTSTRDCSNGGRLEGNFAHRLYV